MPAMVLLRAISLDLTEGSEALEVRKNVGSVSFDVTTEPDRKRV